MSLSDGVQVKSGAFTRNWTSSVPFYSMKQVSVISPKIIWKYVYPAINSPNRPWQIPVERHARMRLRMQPAPTVTKQLENIFRGIG